MTHRPGLHRPARRRRIGLARPARWAMVTAVVTTALGAAASSARADVRDGLAAWYQFDRVFPLAAETPNGGLLPGVAAGGGEGGGSVAPAGSAPVWTDLPGGIESALAIGGEDAGGGVRVEASQTPGHWSDPAGGTLSVWAVVWIDELGLGSAGGAAVNPAGHGVQAPKPAALDHPISTARGLGPTPSGLRERRPVGIVGRGTGDAPGAWRLAADPVTGGLVLHVATEAGPVVLRVNDLPRGRPLGCRVLIDSASVPALVSLVVSRADGTNIGAAAALLPGPVMPAAGPLDFGAAPDASGDAVRLRLDLVAAWTRRLSQPEWDGLATPSGVRRWAEVDGWRGFQAPGRRTARLAGIRDGHVRHVFAGDSFAFSSGWNRVLPAIVRVARFDPIVAVAAGLRAPHAILRTDATFADITGLPNPRPISASNGYRCEYLLGTASQDRYGLPLNRPIELRGTSDAFLPGDGRLLDLTLQPDGFIDMASDPPAAPGDAVLWRLVHRPVAHVPPIPSLRLAPVGTDPNAGVSVDLLAGPPRQAKWSGAQILTTTGADGQARATVREDGPGTFSAPGERFANLLSAVATRTMDGLDGQPTEAPRPGQYLSFLTDVSWSLSDFSSDAEADGSGNGKAYSKEQLAHWLRATTLDADQPIVFWWIVDVEAYSIATSALRTRGLVTVADAACADAGLPRPRHLLIVPPMHARGIFTRDQMWLHFQSFRDAFDAVVDDPAFDHVARMSIFDATDGTYFDGRETSRTWLRNRGYDAFQWGDPDTGPISDLAAATSLLDGGRLHPAGVEAAAFFASFLAAELPDVHPCPADVDGDGTTGFADLLLTLQLWGDCRPAGPCPADVDDDGLVGLSDLLAVLAYWGPCPA